jgi:hypothetical protein
MRPEIFSSPRTAAACPRIMVLSLRLFRKWAERMSFSVYMNNLARDPLRHDVRLTSLNLRNQAIARFQGFERNRDVTKLRLEFP